MMQFIRNVIEYWKHDWIHRRRLFWAELVGVVANIGASLTMALTTPNCPLLPLYVIWFVGSVLLTWTSIQRHNSFMLMLMGFYMLINTIGLIKTFVS